MDIRYSPYGGAAPLTAGDLEILRSLSPEAAVEILRDNGIDSKFKAVKFYRLLNGSSDGPRYDFHDGIRIFAGIDVTSREVLRY